MRPTISPAMNTARTTNTKIPYSPAPTPPNTTSPSMMLTSGTMPPSGVYESCMLFTAPQLASVVTVVNKAEFTMPNRTSLPSMFPPDCSAPACWSMPARSGLPFASAQYAVATPAKNKKAMAAQTAQPWRCEPVIRPSV